MRAAEEAVGRGQRLQHLEVIVALADQELDRLAGGLHGGGEIARLALEFRRLERAVRDDDRAVEPVEMALAMSSSSISR